MGSKNTLVPGNLEWDNSTGCFREAPVQAHPIVNLELTVMADQLRTWHTKLPASQEKRLPRSLYSPGLADTGTQTLSGSRDQMMKLGLREDHRITSAGDKFLGGIGAIPLIIRNPMNGMKTRAIMYLHL